MAITEHKGRGGNASDVLLCVFACCCSLECRQAFIEESERVTMEDRMYSTRRAISSPFTNRDNSSHSLLMAENTLFPLQVDYMAPEKSRSRGLCKQSSWVYLYSIVSTTNDNVCNIDYYK